MRHEKNRERGGGYVLPHRQFPFIAQLFMVESSAFIYIYIYHYALSVLERERFV